MLPDIMDVFGGWQEDVLLATWLIAGSISYEKPNEVYTYKIYMYFIYNHIYTEVHDIHIYIQYIILYIDIGPCLNTVSQWIS